ncbi:MAG: acyltransferase [Ferruginibacter sp.]
MNEKRTYGLDILRSVAILSVLGTHSGWLLPDFINIYIQRYFLDGVSLFFVLSGFLIGLILLKKINETDFGLSQLVNFWARRWFRTLPAFFSTILILLVFGYFNQSLPTIKTLIKCITFSQSLFKDTGALYSEGWSLCVEEWFYLLIPLILFFCIKVLKASQKHLFLITILSIIILTTIARFLRMSQINYSDIHEWDINIRRATFFRLDSIMFGVLGAYLYYYKYQIWKKRNLFFGLGILIFIFIQTTNFLTFSLYFCLPLQSLATLFLLPKLNSIKSGNGIVFTILTFISTISYSLYLMNNTPFYSFIYPVFQKYCVIPQSIPLPKLLAFSLFYLWAFLSAYLMYKLIENPFMKIRERCTRMPPMGALSGKK